MASISNDPGGKRRISFILPNGDRKAIRLGKVSQRTAEGIKYRVEQLVEALHYKHPVEGDLAQWVANLEPSLAQKLARVGLIPNPEAKPATTLGPFLRAYIDGRADLKEATKTVRGLVASDLNEYFGEVRDVRTITPGNADDFKQWLVGRKLAPTTIHKRLQVARSFFHAMRRRKLIDENPFEGVNVAAAGIKDRQRFVTREEVALVLAACPDHHWRCIVALARYGGLRCPSEVLSLRWQDIEWDTGRIVVTSPKTEGHVGKATRVAPLFAELRPFLSEAFDLAPEGSTYVVDERFRKSALGPKGWQNTNLRTTFTKIVNRAGLTIWPRPFHNLRASRETELVEKYPVQVVTDWLGNTPNVALRHYLMTTKEHFEAAVKGDEPKDKTATGRSKGDDTADETKAAQKAAQSAHAGPRGDSQPPSCAHEKTPVLLGLANSCDTIQMFRVAEEGLEPTSHSTGNTIDPPQGGAKSGALGAQNGPLDPDLAAIVKAWPTLPEPIKAGIVAMIGAAK